jgi:exopolyphosphatase/guanosine-5'-triphosphate,3'-diphosphate pyrophosphatase
MEKVAIIDLGSNTARLVLFRMIADGYFVVFDEMREAVRLGQDMERDGFLKTGRVTETIKTLKMFKKLCNAYKVDKIIAVATAAVRRAKNQKSFLDEVSGACGIRLKVLSEDEEALYVYQGVINSTDIPKGIIAEIGGGSTKIIYYNRRNILNHVTLPFGAVTLTDLFIHDDIAPQLQAKKIEDFFIEQLGRYPWLRDVDNDTQFIGVGGSFRNLGKICRRVKKYPLDMAHNYTIEKTDFDNIYDMIKVLDLSKKQKIKGLSPGRADIFPSALSAIKAFMTHLNFKDITVSGCGLREGIMFNYCMPSTNERPLSDVLGYSLSALSKFYNENEKHTEQVYSLSMQLFKQLRVLHKFPRQYVKVLKVASMLSDTGMQVKFYNYPKHSFYIILNSNLYGISHKDLVLSAFVVSASSKDGINPDEMLKYRELFTEEDIDSIKRLGVILRIAKAFDRSMTGCIKNINCDVLGDSVIMKTETTGDCALEIKEALGQGLEFKRAFKKNLEIL